MAQIVSSDDQRRLLADFEQLVKNYKINRPIMKTKIVDFFTTKGLVKDDKLMNEFMVCYIERITQLPSFNLSDLHMQILEFMAESQFASAKEIILMILETNFTYQNEVLWRNALKLIRRIISQVDYKGVRDILGHLLSQFPKLPNTGYALDNQRRSHLEELILFIISPEENLLPAYFVLDEVQKKKCIWKNASHSFRRKIELFIDRFYNIAAMLSSNNRSPLLIISTLVLNNWLKLDNEGKFKLKGHLPYSPSITAPQKELILFILEQTLSLDNIVSITSLGKGKERNHFFEDTLVELVLRAIVKFSHRDSEMPLQEPSPHWDTRIEQLRAKESIKNQQSRQVLIEFFEFLKESFHVRQAELLKFNYYDFVDRESQKQQCRQFWQHVTTLFLSFKAEVFGQCLSFCEILDGICTKVEKLLRKCDYESFELTRDCFMLFLLQVVSRQHGSIPSLNIRKLFQFLEVFYSYQKGTTNDLSFRNEFAETTQSTDSMDDSNADSTQSGNESNIEDSVDVVYSYSGAALFVYLSNICMLDPFLIDLMAKVPEALVGKVKHIWTYKDSPGSIVWHKPYFNVVLLHAYASNKMVSCEIVRHFFENLNWKRSLPLDLVESLPTVGKIKLVNHIFGALKNFNQVRSPPTTSYLCHLETFFRIFNRNTETYIRFDISLLKSFIMFFLNNIQRSSPNWNHFYTLLELVSTRLTNYRVQVLHHINSKPYISLANHPQIFVGLEQATLRTVINFFSADVLHLQMNRDAAESLSFLPQDSHELNMLFVMSLGRAIHINGFETFDPLSNAFTEFLHHIKTNITLNWSAAMYDHFPEFLKKYYQGNVLGRTDKDDKMPELLFDSRNNEFEDHYRHWKLINTDMEIISHLSNSSVSPYLYCILFRSLMDGDLWKSAIYKALVQIGFQTQPGMLRTFCDYLLTHSLSFDDARLERTVTILNDMIFKYNLFSLDRFVLYILMRPANSREAFSGFYLIQNLLLNNESFNNQVRDFISTISGKHWSVSNRVQSTLDFLEKYPEKFYFEHINDDLYSLPKDESCTAFPVFFDSVCLRILSVLDVTIQRFIELPNNEQTSNAMKQLLKVYGDLYKFHDYPINYLYYTLHYYFDALKTKEEFKRQLVVTIIDAFRDSRPKGWALSEQFLNYYHGHIGVEVFDDEYYCSLINRLYIPMVTPSSSPLHEIDYRFNEFPNSGVHGVYSICIEILSLPIGPTIICKKLIEVYTGYMYRTDEQLSITTTALSMLFTTLPDCYITVLYDEIFRVFSEQKNASFKSIPVLLQTMNHGRVFSSPSGRIMSLAHAYLSNANYSKLFNFPAFIKERLRPNIETEEQFIFVCYLIGPSLNRFFTERTRCVLDITTELYDMLRIIDKKIENFKYADTICDLLYHIKYQFTGDSVKDYITPKINELRPALREKLRYIVKFSEHSV